ncbi:MAG: tetratricopeptide repeat protein [Acidobacteria bacterium]|nr:tetratricopeptide repeat protein [Acidobacteriota bacterium]
MRTQLFRSVLAVMFSLALAASALAQGGAVRGKVTDSQGQPVADATVTFETTGRKLETTTDSKGEFLQIGLGSGMYKITASKQGVGTQSLDLNVRQAAGPPLNFVLNPASGLSPAEREAMTKVQDAAQAGLAALNSGNHQEAVTQFTQVVAGVPTCSDCYYNLGLAHSNLKQYAEAEAAFKKVIELKPDSAQAYSGLANLYNAQRKFDEAAAASAKATELSGAGGGGAGASGEALYNQGVILWNAQKYAEAKTQFEAAIKADPNLAMAYYQLGMASLNLGQVPEAVTAFEGYLNVAPNGEKAAEVKGFVAQLKP